MTHMYEPNTHTHTYNCVDTSTCCREVFDLSNSFWMTCIHLNQWFWTKAHTSHKYNTTQMVHAHWDWNRQKLYLQSVKINEKRIQKFLFHSTHQLQLKKKAWRYTIRILQENLNKSSEEKVSVNKTIYQATKIFKFIQKINLTWSQHR